MQPHPLPSLTSREDVGADRVEHRHAGVDQDLGAEVRVAAGDARAGVDHAGDPGRDQRVGGGPVQVDLVEHRDVAAAQPRQQRLGPAVDRAAP